MGGLQLIFAVVREVVDRSNLEWQREERCGQWTREERKESERGIVAVPTLSRLEEALGHGLVTGD